MTSVLLALLPTLGILAGMLACLEIGRRIGVRHLRLWGGDEPGAGAIDGAVFALFGLIIAFTFSGALSRFDYRRGQIVIEANAIGTAYLRLDLLPAEARSPLRPLFREYVASRLATHRALGLDETARHESEKSLGLQAEIWRRAVPAAQSTGSAATQTLVVSSLNEMFDIASARLAAARLHVPLVIVLLLCGLAGAAALVVGHSSALVERRTWFRPVLFALAIASSIYVTFDLELPRVGLIRLDAADQPMVELLDQMK